jgi:hypothetical protein
LKAAPYSRACCDFIAQWKKGKDLFEGEKGKRPLDLFSSGFFLLEEYIQK